MRPIDADEMRENLEWCKSQSEQYNDIYWDDVIARLDAQPTIDAAPVKHGKWKAAKAGGPNYPFWDSRCSECGYTTSMVIRNWSYCPQCGAKMDLEE